MKNRRSGNVKLPVILGIVFVALVLVVGSAGAIWLVGAVQKKQAERVQEKESTNQILDNAQNMLEGKELGKKPTFPDTPVGHMNEIVYDYIAEVSGIEKQFTVDLDATQWATVLEPETLRTKESLEKASKIREKAQTLVENYSKDVEAVLSKTLAKMETEAEKSSDAADFLKGFRGGLEKPGQGVYFVRQMVKVLLENIGHVQEALDLLISRTGKYSVGDDGTILFKASASDKDIDRYNEIMGDIQRTYEELQRLDQQRVSTSKEALERARNR